jgi:hypothetical protein
LNVASFKKEAEMYLFAIGQYEIDPVAATLWTAVFVLIGQLVVNVLNATYLESKRQDRIHDKEKKALREAVYSEIAWMLKEIGRTIEASYELPEGDVLTFYRSWDEFKSAVFSRFKSHVYDAARQNPALFYQLEDAFGIESFYRRAQAVLPIVADSSLSPFFSQDNSVL